MSLPQTEHVQDALYNYLQILLRDRIHLVNRYERLRAVDSEQAERKSASIHDRLRLIVDRINDALNQLRRYSNLQTKIEPRIRKSQVINACTLLFFCSGALFAEFDEVNQAADKLLIAYAASSTTKKARLLPLGRDEKKIYPTSTASNDEVNNEYDYATNDEYDEDDDDDAEIKSTSSTTTAATTTSVASSTSTDADAVNYDQIDTGDSDWDTRPDETEADDESEKAESKFEITIDEPNQQAFINEVRARLRFDRC